VKLDAGRKVGALVVAWGFLLVLLALYVVAAQCARG
jgi:hypothetical protein